MNQEIKIPTASVRPRDSKKAQHLKRLKIVGAALTVLGILLFAYFVYSVGVREILSGIGRIGFERANKHVDASRLLQRASGIATNVFKLMKVALEYCEPSMTLRNMHPAIGILVPSLAVVMRRPNEMCKNIIEAA